MTVIRPWIGKKIIELLGFEDEVVAEYAMGLLEDESQPVSLVPFQDRVLFPLFLVTYLLTQIPSYKKGTRP